MKLTGKQTPAEASRLARQIGKRKPFDLLEEELFVSLIRTVDLLSHSGEELMEQFRLTGSLYNALRIVGGESRVNPDGITVGTIASRLVRRNPDTTRLVDRLEKLGYVQSVTCPEDGRRRMVRITAEGARVLQALRRPLRAMHRRQFRSLPRTTLQQMLSTLEEIRNNLES